jgi:gamma-D-glutamyl-L-lysine dipeptidyl-peptidase
MTFDPNQTGSPGGESPYGICHLSVVPVRLKPAEHAELGTQLLFGDVFVIEETSPDNKWIRITITTDNYSGWIDIKQFRKISRQYYDLTLTYESPLCKGLIGLLKSDKRFIPILMGSSLPFYKNGSVTLEGEILSYEGEIVYVKRTNDPRQVEAVAHYYLGAPYLWGGKGHFGIDCSGFVQQTFRFCGYNLPRDAWQQAECGTDVAYPNSKGGDMAFFSEDGGKITHVGIITQNGRIIHASGEVRIDHFDPKGIFNVERKVYSHRLVAIKRLL